MKNKIIYGVNLSQPVTVLVVRDALVKCFSAAHCADVGLGLNKNLFINEGYCQEIVRKAFADAGESFDQPTKEGIIKALENLKIFAGNFRNPHIIKKHYKEIMTLVDKLK